jgi:hypothetical protein
MMEAMTTWVIASLILMLPTDFTLADQSRNEVSMAVGPPGMKVMEEHRVWKNKEGHTLHLFWWAPMAPRDGGPMVAARESEVVVAGARTRIIETKQFLGRDQRVLVTHLHIEKPEAQVMIYTPDLSEEEFRRILESVRLQEREP